MKKVICLLLAVLVLLVAGCTAKPQPTPETQPPQTELPTQPKQFSDDPDIAAVWVNGGTTPDGEEYVETMTLLEDGRAIVSMQYQGSDYESLFGTYTALNSVLTVFIDDEVPYQQTYQYELDANVLTLYDSEKTVTYRRSD